MNVTSNPNALAVAMVYGPWTMDSSAVEVFH